MSGPDPRSPIALVSLALLACGGSPPPSPPPERAARPAPVRAAEPEDTPFPRAVALPPAPRMIVEIDLDALRPTPLYAALHEEMGGRGAEDRVGRTVVERASRVTMAAYGRPPRLVMIARGPVAGLVDEVIATLRADGRDPRPARQLGFTAWYVADDMVIVEVAPDAVAVVYPEHLSEVLRTAAGQAPATPLPEALRALRERPALRDAPMAMVFEAREAEPGSDPLSNLIAAAGAAAVAGRIEGNDVVATGMARVETPARATTLARELEAYARGTPPSSGRDAGLADGIRDAAVRVDGEWVEVDVRFPHEHLEDFLDVVDPLER